MKVSVCITTFNEKTETIKKLLDALKSQTLKPDEIIIVDASASPIFNSQFTISNEFSISNLQFINRAGVSRARGRNIAIGKARNEIIALTDAGCIPHKDWLTRLCSKFEIGEVKKNVVAGGYRMVANNSFQKAERIFLGVRTKDMGRDFMASARSMAFTKTIWKKAGGFPESLNDTAEDTIFNLNLLNAGAKFVVTKNAVVDWQMPNSIKNFYLKIKNYARGDAQSGIWWHPVKKFKTHNLKILTIFGRYLLAFIFLAFGFYKLLLLYVLCYMLYAYKKAKWWGIVLQFVSDFACIIGFSHGLLQTSS